MFTHFYYNEVIAIRNVSSKLCGKGVYMKDAKERKDTVRLNFEFPKKEYPYLKLLCAKKGISLRELATELLIKAIEDAEDEMLSKKANERLNNLKDEDLVDWSEATRAAGWE